MAERITFYTDEQTRNLLKKMADDDHRSVSSFLTLLIQKHYHIVRVGELPHPDDAYPVPLVEVE